MTERAYLETSPRWSYAVALDWPGWARHAKGREDPVAALLADGPRYRAVLAPAGIVFVPPTEVEVVAVLEGNSGTAWGVPSIIPEGDLQPPDEPEAGRLMAILRAAWQAFDHAVIEAEGHRLATGPRGGGRDLDGIVRHCLEADQAYLSKLGARRPKTGTDDPLRIMAAVRERAVETFGDRLAGRAWREPSRTVERWPLRWYVRYVAWHTLVHTWEIEERRLG